MISQNSQSESSRFAIILDYIRFNFTMNAQSQYHCNKMKADTIIQKADGQKMYYFSHFSSMWQNSVVLIS